MTHPTAPRLGSNKLIVVVWDDGVYWWLPCKVVWYGALIIISDDGDIVTIHSLLRLAKHLPPAKLPYWDPDRLIIVLLLVGVNVISFVFSLIVKSFVLIQLLEDYLWDQYFY